MRRSILVLICIAIVASMSFPAVAAAQPAPKPVTMAIEAAESLLADAVAALQSQIDALAERLGVVEDDFAALEGRVDAIETSGDGGADDFWARRDAFYSEMVVTIDEPAVVGYTWLYYDTGTYEFTVRGPMIQTTYRGEPAGGGASEAFIIYRIDGVEYLPGFFPGNGPIEEAPREGAAIEIEYWYEVYGQRFHDVKTIPEGSWTYNKR